MMSSSNQPAWPSQMRLNRYIYISSEILDFE